jgi:hypothetical protein
MAGRVCRIRGRGARVTGVLHGGGYTIGNSDSVRAYDQLHHAYGYKALIFTAVFAGHNDPGKGF